jgi:L-ribulose-5-phosphate 3-epimerase
MTNLISFVTANFIAREAGYRLTAGWDEGQQATEAFFRPAATFERRFDEMLTEICEMGFQAVDIWTGHLSPAWATAEQVVQARHSIERHGLRLVSVAGYFGSTPDEFEPFCRLAADLGAPLLGGVAPVVGTHRDQVVALLQSFGLRLAIENHRERSATELLAALGLAPLTGACVDTGSFATRGCDASEAIEQLGERVIHVHFRDVVPGGSDASVALGQGCVPLEACVAALRRLRYSGAISVEHEPEDRPPHEECRASLRLLRSWLS